MDTLLKVKIGVIRATKVTRMPAFELRTILPTPHRHRHESAESTGRLRSDR